MARKLLFRSSVFPYHVTARGNNREDFPVSLQVMWEIFGKYFAEIEKEYHAKIHAFVLMPNHFHLLISTPKEDLGVVMQKLMREVTKKANAKSGRTGRIFGARYHWSVIMNENYYDCALKYVYRNPVKADLVDRAEEYLYSTLANVLGKSELHFTLRPHNGEHEIIPYGQEHEFLSWLNQAFQTEQDHEIKKGLLRTTFEPPLSGWDRKRSNFNAMVIRK
ncbi:MAG: transposase [Bdellovibrionales bacterium]|nr:transposase [Oligoflexia bacterium]